MASNEAKTPIENSGMLLFPSNAYSLQIVSQLTGISEKDLQKNSSPPLTWKLNTKYYTCDVPILHSVDANQLKLILNDREALILILAPNEEIDCWGQIKSQTQVLNDASIDVKMMIVHYSSAEKAGLHKEIECWCTENQFELINLTDTPEDDYDVVGIDRVRQTLQAHTWSNLVMKDKPSVRSKYMEDLSTECTKHDASEDHTENNQTNGCGLSEELLSSALSDPGEGGVESFEKLFAELRVMKEQSENMSPETRKKFAETVALSFYSALGGSDTDDD